MTIMYASAQAIQYICPDAITPQTLRPNHNVRLHACVWTLAHEAGMFKTCLHSLPHADAVRRWRRDGGNRGRAGRGDTLVIAACCQAAVTSGKNCAIFCLHSTPPHNAPGAFVSCVVGVGLGRLACAANGDIRKKLGSCASTSGAAAAACLSSSRRRPRF